jgi:peptidylprolyl isomerase
MNSKLSSIAILAALTTAAAAQTTPATHTATHHAAAATTAKQPTPNIPKVVGIPKTLYALKYIDITVGTGPLVETSVLGTSQADSKIIWYTVRYTGWLTDGTKFDSSYDHAEGKPFTFPAGAHRVIPGWDSGFQGMHIGGKRRLFIPYQLAYGEAGRPPIPAKSDLIFDIELVSQSNNPPEELTQPRQQPSQQPSQSTPPPASTPKPDETPADKPATPPQPETTPHPQAF